MHWKDRDFYSLFLLYLGLVLVIQACDRRDADLQSASPGLVTIAVTAMSAETLHITLTTQQPVSRLDMGPASLSDSRLTSWRFDTHSAGLQLVNGRLFLIQEGGIPFQEVSFTATLPQKSLIKQYRPSYRFGEEGLVCYTGAFWPYDEQGVRVNVQFHVTPGSDETVFAFGHHAASLSGWQSPENHPAFIYMGNDEATLTDHAAILIDHSTPDWISGEMMALIEALLPALENMLGQPLSRVPDILITDATRQLDGLNASGFRFEGDALPGQVLISLSGRAWDTPSSAGVDILRRAGTHEIVHLWQTMIRPQNEGVPDWIHEGAAEAITAEILVAIGLWDAERATKFFQKAYADCASAIEGRSLKEAERAGAINASYACGHILAVIAAGPGQDMAVSGFWRDFIKKSMQTGGYSEESWLAFVEQRTSVKDLSKNLAAFLRTPWLLPAVELDRLLTLSGASPTSIPPPLAEERAH